MKPAKYSHNAVLTLIPGDLDSWTDVEDDKQRKSLFVWAKRRSIKLTSRKLNGFGFRIWRA